MDRVVTVSNLVNYNHAIHACHSKIGEITMFKHIKEIDLNPSRNFGYTAYFVTDDSMTVCETCMCDFQSQADDGYMDGWGTTENYFVFETTEFKEVGNQETFGLMCDACNTEIIPDCGHLPLLEQIKFLMKNQGYDLQSAFDYCRSPRFSKTVCENRFIQLVDYLSIKEANLLTLGNHYQDFLFDNGITCLEEEMDKLLKNWISDVSISSTLYSKTLRDYEV